MSYGFLKCTPSVFVIGDEYEILLWAKKNGLFCVQIGEESFYEENSGVLSTEKSLARIRVPQSVLDKAKSYRVVFRETIIRRSYFPELGAEERCMFAFKPLQKTEDIHIYHLADVHYRFELAKQTASYFGADTDLFVVNGDIGEVETEENYFEVAKFVGDIAQGSIPVVFVRGNHDSRGRLAEKYTDVFPCDGKNTYFSFSVGCISGVALDCGEDKMDSHPEYGSVNAFEPFRRRQTEFLRKTTLKEDSIRFAISHVCPVLTSYTKGGLFDIEKDVYTEWNQELERMGIAFMMCGHMHKAQFISSDDPMSILPHAYPVVFGSACFGDDDFWGAAFILNKDKTEIFFTDKNKQVREKYCI